jgi:GT2 family glycosyltransferase
MQTENSLNIDKPKSNIEYQISNIEYSKSEIPTIDIIVPTYNRPDDIQKFIQEIQIQSYPHFKVFIIDDHGEETVEHLIPKDDARFYFERLPQNRGQAYVRNYALKKGSAPIVVFMDDDAWFLDIDALYKTAEYFQQENDMGCLMFDIDEPGRDWLSDRFNLDDMQELGEFIACGAAFNRNAFEQIGGFSEFLHSYGEETDIAMRLIGSGSKLYFGKNIRVYHNYQPGQRDLTWFKRFKHNSVRNDLLIVLLRYPSLYILPYFILKIFSHVLFSIQNKEETSIIAVQQIILAFFSSLKMLPQAIKMRKSLSITEFNYWKKHRL